MTSAVTLAELTTFGVGGPVRAYREAASVDEIRAALAGADQAGAPLVVLGGGSNVLAADRGLEALVLRVRARGIHAERDGDATRVAVEAGHGFDELVAFCVGAGLAGVECLSGIPGDVGAAPMQNVGAYGQEVASSIESVRVVDRRDGRAVELARDALGFGYRDSIFKREARDRYVVTSVAFRFAGGGASPAGYLDGSPAVYPELARALEAVDRPSLDDVRRTVLALRRRKSMVFDPSDANHRSAGSFFVNPTVTALAADHAAERAAELAPGERMPRFTTPQGDKLSAAWLIERAGLGKGTRRGAVGLSTNHTLALVNFGGATARELVAFAVEVRRRVRDAFGIALTPEPQLLGFTVDEVAPLFD